MNRQQAYKSMHKVEKQRAKIFNKRTRQIFKLFRDKHLKSSTYENGTLTFIYNNGQIFKAKGMAIDTLLNIKGVS